MKMLLRFAMLVSSTFSVATIGAVFEARAEIKESTLSALHQQAIEAAVDARCSLRGVLTDRSTIVTQTTRGTRYVSRMLFVVRIDQGDYERHHLTIVSERISGASSNEPEYFLVPTVISHSPTLHCE